ncbi:MAG: TadE family protein [bacterium]
MTMIKFRYHLRKKRSQRGQSLVEFALLLPILVILFMGMFDFGWILHQQIQMDNATRLGARRGAVGDSNTLIIQKMTENSTINLLADEITIQVIDQDGVPIGDNNDRTPDNYILIEIDRPNIQLVTPLANFIEGLGSIDLHSEAEFLIE